MHSAYVLDVHTYTAGIKVTVHHLWDHKWLLISPLSLHIPVICTETYVALSWIETCDYSWNQPGKRQLPWFALRTHQPLGTSLYLSTSLSVRRDIASFLSFVLYFLSFGLFLFSITNALASSHSTAPKVRDDERTQGSADYQNVLASASLQS